MLYLFWYAPSITIYHFCWMMFKDIPRKFISQRIFRHVSTGGLDLQQWFARGFGRARIWCLGLPRVTRQTAAITVTHDWGVHIPPIEVVMTAGVVYEIVFTTWRDLAWFIKPSSSGKLTVWHHQVLQVNQPFSIAMLVYHRVEFVVLCFLADIIWRYDGDTVLWE